MHRFHRAIIVAALLGCSDATEPLPPGPPPVFLVTPGQQWSGGVIAVRSAYFEGLSTLPSFTIAQDTVTPTRLDDSTVSLLLPQGPSASVPVEVILADTVVSAGVVGRVGFRESRALLPALGGELHHVGTEILGLTYHAQFSAGRLGRVPLVAGTGSIDSTLRGTSEFWYGLSPTQVPGQYVLRDTTTQLLAVYDLVGGVPVAVDSVPFIGTAYVRHAARLSDSVWLFTGSHRSYTSIRGPVPVPRVVQVETESPWRVFVSAAARRATISENVTFGGVPVFDTESGDTAFSLPIQGLEGAAFSQSGELLFAVGGLYYYPHDLVRVDAATGAVQAQAQLPDSLAGFSLAYDDALDRVFVAAVRGQIRGLSEVFLVVLRGADLTPIAVLAAGADCDTAAAAIGCWEGELVLDGNTAHVALPGVSATRDLVFDLLP